MGILKITAASAALTLIAASASAAPSFRLTEAIDLGRQMGAAATMAERAAPSDALAASVRAAVQNTIIGSAADPMVVVAAFDQVSAACGGGRSASGWTCPSSPEAYRALAEVRSIVIAQVEQTDPAAFDTPGSAPLGAVPSTSAGGSNYRGL